ncbi:MAG: DNA repair protein RecO [Solobacterium sp.]|nr:DNA repair protein RecO [Solobacterium sp.]
MNEKLTGLILRERDYKDNSVLLTVLTKEYGKLSLVAQGARKMSSKNRSSVFPYTKGEFLFDYKEGRTMFRMRTAHTVKMYRHLHENLNASLACGVLAEVIDSFLPEGTDLSFSMFCYDLFESACEALDQGHRDDIVLAVGLARMMETQGIAPDVDECVLCGRTVVTSLSVKEGGFLCSSCALAHGIAPAEAADLRAFRLINKARMEHLSILETHMESARKECGLLTEFIRTHAGIPVKSFALYQRMSLI